MCSRAWWSLLFWLMVLVAAVPAAARDEHQHRVVVLEPAAPDEQVEMRARLRGELQAAGFEVIVLTLSSGEDPRATGEKRARELQATAVLYVTQPSSRTESSTAAPRAEIWIADRQLRRSFVLQFDPERNDGERSYAGVAVHAVELLKANLAELSIAAEEESATVAPSPAQPIASAAPAPRGSPDAGGQRVGIGLSLHAGVAVLQGFQGLGPIWTPMLRLGASLPSRWFGDAPFTLDVLAQGAFYGGEARVEGREGAAVVSQSSAALELWARFVPTEVAQPLLTVSVGAYRARVEGDSTDASRERSADTWSLSNGVGAGLWMQPAANLAVVAQGEVLVVWERTELRVADQYVGTAGWPMLLLSLGVAGVF